MAGATVNPQRFELDAPAIWTPEPKRVPWRSIVVLHPGDGLAAIDVIGRAFLVQDKNRSDVCAPVEFELIRLPDPPPED